MNVGQAKEILQRYREGKTTAAENVWVERWYLKLVETGEEEWEEGEKEALGQLMEARLMRQINSTPAAAPKIRRLFTRSRAIAASIAIALLIGAGGLLLISRQGNGDRPPRLAELSAPQHNIATITLSNGDVIFLDSAGTGTLASQGDVNLIKNGSGDLAYESGAAPAGETMQYNSLTNPKGSRVVKIMLSDGTRVWLDAGSSLTYPVSFPGAERRVSVSGEAFFEVARNAQKPFFVDNAAASIRVIGTHFNVNAHADNPNMQVTLIEGAVSVYKGEGSSLLKPGQQAIVGNNQRGAGEIEVVDSVDLEAVVAWKHGYFHFSKSSLPEVLKQLSRWYNVEFEYESGIPAKQFMGEIERDLSLVQALQILETNGVRFKIDGDKIIVRK